MVVQMSDSCQVSSGELSFSPGSAEVSSSWKEPIFSPYSSL